MKRLTVVVALVALSIAAVACTAPAATPTAVPPTAVPPTVTKPPAAAPTAPAASIVLPDGTRRDFAGRGATLAFDGKRLNYTCGSAEVGILGDIRKAGAGIAVERVALARKDNAWTIAKSETITMEIATIELPDGTACANAGKGATLAFDGKRLNYSCGGDELGLIGDLQINGEFVSAERARFARENNAWVLKQSAVMPVRLLRAAP